MNSQGAEMHSEDPIRRILIVGGGAAGWMAALYLSRFLRYSNALITLMEPTGVGSAGVGEGSYPKLAGMLRNLRLDTDAFMRACNATYKLGTRFDDWQRPGEGYWHPLGICGGTIDGVDLFHPWLRAQRIGTESRDYLDFSMQVASCEGLKAPRPLTGSSPIIETGGYAFHLDSASLASYFRQIAVSEGVVHLFDDPQEVERGEDGAISGVRTTSERIVNADLYIDCSAPRAKLIEDALGDPWIDWADHCPCDKAVLSPLPRDPSIPPFTEASALAAGWRWRIPLSHRVGIGYLYSSRHIDDDSALMELLSREPPQQTLGAVPRLFSMRVGRRTHFWRHNCVALGDAAGMLEPLGATGLLLVQHVLETLMEHFPDRRFDSVLMRDFNKSLGSAYDETRDFVLLHYLLSQRADTDFWREVRTLQMPDSLAEILERYDATGALPRSGNPVGPEHWRYLLYGNGRVPRRPSPQVSRINPEQAQAILSRIIEKQRELVDTLPTHRSLIQSIHERTW